MGAINSRHMVSLTTHAEINQESGMRSPTAVRGSLPGLPARVLSGIVVLAATAACSSSNNTIPSTLTAVSGSGQSGAVTSTISAPLIVQVKDQNGNPISGVHVTFNSTGGASASNPVATTDGSGNAQTSITLSTVSGTDTVTAFADSITSAVNFIVTATPGAPAALVVVSGGNQTATAGSTLINGLVVQVQDQYGNPVPGATITWTASSGTLTATAQSTTDPNGNQTEQLQLPATPGSVTVTATIQGTTISSTFTETAD
jgi:hypothetical protein